MRSPRDGMMAAFDVEVEHSGVVFNLADFILWDVVRSLHVDEKIFYDHGAFRRRAQAAVYVNDLTRVDDESERSVHGNYEEISVSASVGFNRFREIDGFEDGLCYIRIENTFWYLKNFVIVPVVEVECKQRSVRDRFVRNGVL